MHGNIDNTLIWSIFTALRKLLILSGDIELKPGSNNTNNISFSIFQLNIRSIQNKLDYVRDNLLDYNLLCFTETHLSQDIPNSDIDLDGFDILYRKDLSSHSGGLLLYTSSNYRLTSIFSEKISPANDGLFVVDGLFVHEGLYVYVQLT